MASRTQSPNGAPPQIIVNRPKWLDVIPPSMRNNAREFFVGVVEFLPLAASGSQANDLRIDSDAYFLILASTRIVTDVANTTFLTLAPELALLTDSGSGRFLTSSAVHVESLFGDAQDPYEWPYPKLMSPGSTLTVQLQNLEATARNVRLAFHGMKIFNYQQG